MINWNDEALSRKEDLLNDLFNLLKIQSIKDETSSTPEAPMGKKIGEALDFALNLCEGIGLKTKNIDGYAGHAELIQDVNEETIGILCHVDVVPATGEWTSPPFEPVIRDGKLFARGAIDDKGPTIAAFYGLKIVKELGLPLKKNIRMIFGTDEESGMSCMKYYKEVETMPTIGFAPDADFPMINAEKGQINVEISLNVEADVEQSTEAELISFKAGDRINMVPERATAILTGNVENILAQFDPFCSEHNLKYKISQHEHMLELTLFGISAHGMEPHVGINAGTLFAKFLQEFALSNRASNFLNFVSDMHEDFEGEQLQIQYFDDITGPLTVNPGIISYDKDGEATLQLNIRCPVTTNYEETKSKLTRELERRHFFISAQRESNPHHVPADHTVIHVLQKVYEEESGLEPTLLSTGGATYAKFMSSGVAFGACFPGKEMTAHQKDEYIEIEDLLKATAIYARAIYELAK
jgi:succinyl-diaminopimelate desuccinylase